jgi:hypothetical protein
MDKPQKIECNDDDQYIKLTDAGSKYNRDCGECRPIWTENPELKASETPKSSIDDYLRQKSREDGGSEYGDLLNNYGQCINYAKKYNFLDENTARRLKEDAQNRKIVEPGKWRFFNTYQDKSTEELKGICDNPINEEEQKLCRILNYYIQADRYLNDNDTDSPNIVSREIRRMFGYPNQVEDSGTIDFKLMPIPAGLPNAGKTDVDSYKGLIYGLTATNISHKMMKYINDERKLTGKSPLKKPTKEDLIQEQLTDVFMYIQRKREKESGAGGTGGIDSMDILSIFKGQASSTEFEVCMNENIFNTRLNNKYKDHDEDIQLKISEMTDIKKLTPIEVDYIEDKLKIIATVDPEDAMECMNILNIGEMICDKGVSDRMLKMAYLVMHIIGLDKMNLDDIHRGTHDYQRLKHILDRLTPYIRKAVKNIIKISKYYEKQTCGHESASTHILETIYNDVFEKTKEVDINIQGLDLIPTYLIKDTNMMEFAKTIILLIVMIAGIYVLMMILNRPVAVASA